MTSITLNKVDMILPTGAKHMPTAQNRTEIGVAGRFALDPVSQRPGILALKNVSIELNEGDTLGIVGSNGAGKSTLLRLMAGIYSPTRGVVRTEGNISTMFNIGLGMQLDASGMQNIMLSGIIAGHSRKQIEKVLPDIIDFTELGDFLHLPVRTYSQGMAMRLKFACATAFSPEILLLDEWIGAGDAEFQAKAQDRMKELLSDAGIVVLATHNEKLMKSTANRAIWLERGTVMM